MKKLLKSDRICQSYAQIKKGRLLLWGHKEWHTSTACLTALMASEAWRVSTAALSPSSRTLSDHCSRSATVPCSFRLHDVSILELTDDTTHRIVSTQHSLTTSRLCSESANLKASDLYQQWSSMFWIHYLAGVSHFAKCPKIQPLTVWEMLINLL